MGGGLGLITWIPEKKLCWCWREMIDLGKKCNFAEQCYLAKVNQIDSVSWKCKVVKFQSYLGKRVLRGRNAF